MSYHYIKFPFTRDGLRLAATFIASLVKEGVTYVIDQNEDDIKVTITGGF